MYCSIEHGREGWYADSVCVRHRDPNVFPDGDVFRPDRFLDESGQNEIAPPDTHNMGHVTFGFGRRSVPVPSRVP